MDKEKDSKAIEHKQKPIVVKKGSGKTKITTITPGKVEKFSFEPKFLTKIEPSPISKPSKDEDEK